MTSEGRLGGKGKNVSFTTEQVFGFYGIGARIARAGCGGAWSGQESGCTRTQGYWKNHLEGWSSRNLSLGGVSYDASQLVSTLKTAAGSKNTAANWAISLAHQLIATKLNILAGADPSAVSGLVSALAAFNDGLICPGYCAE